MVREKVFGIQLERYYYLIYLIGSLRNPNITKLGRLIRGLTGQRVFDDWHGAGPVADDAWKEYSQARGQSYGEALEDIAATHVFEFDLKHLNLASTVVLVLPAGKSGHLELGYSVGKGKRTYILLEQGEDPRWDVMYKFADKVFASPEELVNQIIKDNKAEKEIAYVA